MVCLMQECSSYRAGGKDKPSDGTFRARRTKLSKVHFLNLIRCLDSVGQGVGGSNPIKAILLRSRLVRTAPSTQASTWAPQSLPRRRDAWCQ